MQSLSTNDTLTDTFADIGGDINLTGFTNIRFIFNIDINDSKKIIFRLVNQDGSNQTVLGENIERVNKTTLREDEEIEVAEDIDQRKEIEFVTNGTVLTARLQAKVKKVGSTAGILLSTDFNTFYQQ